MKKTSLLNALGSFFLFGVGSLVGLLNDPGLALAEWTVNDNFDSYVDGSDIAGQGAWLNVGVAHVDDDQASSAPNALKFYGSQTGVRIQNTEGDILPSIPFKIWVENTASSGQFGGYTVDQFSFLNDDGTHFKILNGDGTTAYDQLDYQTWIDLVVQYDCNDPDHMRLSVDGGLNFSSWSEMVSNWCTTIDQGRWSAGAGNWWIDDVGTEALPPEPIPGWSPIVTPTYPIDGETNVTDLTEFTVSGLVEIPTSNPYTYHDLTVVFDRVGTTKLFTENIVLPDLIAGESYSYSATSTLDDGFAYTVRYITAGETDFFTTTLEQHKVDKTYLTETASLVPPWTASTGWIAPELADCSGLTGVEKVACDIQNTLLGLVIPSQDKLDVLARTMAGFNEKFPLNYIKEIQDFFTDVQAGLDDDKAVSFAVFGQAGTMDATFWNTSVTIGGSAQSIGAIFKGFITAIFIISFLGWTLMFVKKIF